MHLTDDQRTYLDDHVWAVLATGRADGSPQVSMVGYARDDQDRLLLSVKAYTAKWRNSLRQPRVAVLVPDGRRQLVVYGVAEAVDEDPDRAELTADVWARIGGNERADPTTLVPLLDEQQRVVLRITPEHVLQND